MANHERGEVSLDVQGVIYTLRPEFNALCELEAQMDLTIQEVLKLAERGAVRALRGLLWAYLQPRHRAQFPDLAAVGSLIERMGGIEPALKAVASCLEANRASATGRNKKKKDDAGPLATTTADLNGADSFETPVALV